MGKRGGGFDVHVGGFGHHAAKQGDVQGVQRGVEGFFGDFGQLFVFEFAGVKAVVLRIGGKGGGFAVADEQQSVVHDEFCQFLAAFLGLAFCGPGLLAGLGKEAGGLLGARGQLHAKPGHGQAHLALPALRADACAGHAADHGSFGRTHVVAVQAGDGERLQDVVLDAGVLVSVGHGQCLRVQAKIQAKGWSTKGTICSRPQPKARPRPMPWLKLC